MAAPLPDIASGYFDTYNRALDARNKSSISGHQQYAKFLQDMGVRQGAGGALTPDASNPYGTYQQIDAAAQQNSADRGFGAGGALKVAAADQPRYQAMRSIVDARDALIGGDYDSNAAYRRTMAEARRGSARYGVEQGAYTVPKVRY